MIVNENRNIEERLTAHITLTETVNASVEQAYARIRACAAEGRGVTDMKENRAEKTNLLAKEDHRRGKSRYRTAVAAAAVCAMVVGVPATVLAATGFFSREARLEQDTLTYTFDINYELQPGVFDVTANYIPEGYAGNGMKYHCEDGWKKDFSLMPVMNTAELAKRENDLTQYMVEDVEHTVLSGIDADIVTFKEADKYEAPTIIFLFNEAEGYVMEVWGDYGVPREELVKVADNLKITRTGAFDTAFSQELEDEEKVVEQQLEEELEGKLAAGLPEANVIPVGQGYTWQHPLNGCQVTYTVQEVQVSDTLGEADTAYFSDYEELTPWLKEDGSLRPYTRLEYSEDGRGIVAEELTEQCFLKVNVRAEMKYGEPAEDAYITDKGVTGLDACLMRLGENKDGAYERDSTLYGSVASEHYFLQTDGRCIYLDAPNPLDGGLFFYRNMKDGDCIEYQMIFVVDRDALEGTLVLDFNELCNQYPEGIYFAIQ